MTWKQLICVCVVVSCVSSAKLPRYIKACSKSDKNLNECALNSANLAYPEIIKGDKQYKIPVLEPFQLELVNLDVGNNLKMTFKDVIIYGLGDLKVTGAEIDVEKKHWRLRATTSSLRMIVKYDIKGRILILPIVGQGPANITMENPNFRYDFDYELVEQKGVQHIKLLNAELEYIPKRMYFELENLFNGDKRLGPEMNRFLNENWADVLNEIGPALGETVKSVATSIFTSYFRKVPFDQIFKP